MINQNPYEGPQPSAEPAAGAPQSICPRRDYAAPTLIQYGTLAELTQQLSVATPVADALGASNAS